MIFGLFMIIGHGWPKFEKILSGDFGFADPLGMGAKTSLFLIVFAELLCSVALILGFMTRWALIPLMFAMLVAAFVVNGGEPFTQMEKALMFFVIFALIWITGPGTLSVDNALNKKKKA
jgi:putative oxidoreductase